MKRLISLVISVVLLFSTIPAQLVFAADGTASYDKEITVLTQLGFLNNASRDVDESLSRGEFANILLSFMNADTIDTSGVVITDINEYHDYYPAMCRAIKMGLITGPVTRADDSVSYNEAIKMIVYMLGYNLYALHKGGWPTGYISIAQSIDLLDGVSAAGDIPLTYGDALVLLYNAVCTDVLEPVSIGTDTSYATTEGRTILAQSHRIMKGEGIVESVKGKSIEKDIDLSENEVMIDGFLFKTDLSEFNDYVGMNVLYWYNTDKNTVCAVYPENNEVIKVDAEDAYTFSNRTLYYSAYSDSHPNGVEKKILISQTASVLYNDVVIDSFSDSYFLNKQGEFTFIDNNGDGAIDVVLLDVTDDYVVKNVDTYSQTIYDLYDENLSLCISDESGADVSLVDSFGREMLLSELMRYDVISVKRSYDGSKITAIYSNHEVRGSVEGVSTTGEGKMYVTIRGTEYETTPAFAGNEILKIGEWGVFGITATGKIACINRSFNTEGSFYGYLINAAAGQGLDATYKLRLLTQQGEVAAVSLAKRVNIDGKSENASDVYALLGGSALTPQPVIYDVNADGYISRLDTLVYNSATETVDSLTELYSCFETGYDESGNVVETASETLEWRSGTGIFGSKIPTHANTILFTVGSSKNSPDEDFQVRKLSSLGLNYYSFKAYKTVGDSPLADIIVMNSGSSYVAADDDYFLISNITEGVDENGDVVTKLYLYKKSVESVMYVKDKTVLQNAKWSEAADNELPLNHTFVPGDIIRFTTDTSGFINRIELIYDRAGNEFYTPTYYNTEGASASVRISFNEVYQQYNGKLFVHKGPIPDGTESVGLENLECYNASNFTFLIFDPDDRENIIKTGNITDISDYKTTGQGSMIFLQTTYTSGGFVIIYRNLQ